MGKHTPGPWAVEVSSDGAKVGPWSGKWSDSYDGGLPIVDTVLFTVDRKDKATLDDLYLIAAAPDMADEIEKLKAQRDALLKACKMALEVMSCTLEVAATTDIQIGDLDMLRAAIKKAGGDG